MLIDIQCQEIKNITVKSIFVKAICDKKVVGCGYGTTEHGYVGIYGLHVDEYYRKKGIGTSICQAIFTFGRKNGAKKAYLIVHSRNNTAIALYSHMGFTKMYEYDFYQKSDSKYKIIDA
nr:GNAT family N-acetyltransferase [Pectinatus sottacetonis]